MYSHSWARGTNILKLPPTKNLRAMIAIGFLSCLYLFLKSISEEGYREKLWRMQKLILYQHQDKTAQKWWGKLVGVKAASLLVRQREGFSRFCPTSLLDLFQKQHSEQVTNKYLPSFFMSG